MYEELDKVQMDRHFDLDEDRRPRSMEEMAQEALELRALFPHRQEGIIHDDGAKVAR